MYSKKETVKVLLYDLKPHPKNPKKHNDSLIEKSISELGYAENIVIDENNVILAGHGRVDAMKKTGGVEAGGMEVEAIRISGWTEEEKEKYLLLSNQSTILGGFDSLLLKDFDGLILDYVGLDSDILIEPDEKDDEIPEDVPPMAKLGDLYQLGNHRVLCGDSTKIEDVERLMNGKKADMVFTDPPFGLAFNGRSGDFDVIKGDHKQSNEEFLGLIDGFSVPMFSVVKREAPCFIKIDWRKYPLVVEVVSKYAKIWNTIIWGKDRMGMGKKYRFSYEILVACSLEEPNLYIDRKQPDLYIGEAMNTFGRNRDWKEENEQVHPTQTPVNVICKFVKDGSNMDDLVMDSFLGSGSTLIAAEKTGRICYGMELDPKYVDVIVKRWEEYTGQKAEKLA